MAGNRSIERTREGASIAVGTVLIVLGIVFIVGQFLSLDLGRIFWPFFIILPGLAFFAAMALGGRHLGPLAIPGSIVTTVGLILLYQNTTGHWESWTYAWGLIVAAVGAGIYINGLWTEQPKLLADGRRVATVGLVLFVLFGTFFELILNISGIFGFGRWLWPLLLVGLGVYLLARRSGHPEAS